MNNYNLWLDMPDEYKAMFVREYVNEIEPLEDELEIAESMELVGILKTIEYELQNVDKPEDKQRIQKNVPIGILGLNINETKKWGKIINVRFSYIQPKYRGDFKNFFTFLLETIKQGGYKYVGFNFDDRTSRFITKNTKSDKAAVYYHFGKVDDFALKPSELPVDILSHPIKVEPRIVSLEPVEKPIDIALNGSKKPVKKVKKDTEKKAIEKQLIDEGIERPLTPATPSAKKTGGYPAEREVKE